MRREAGILKRGPGSLLGRANAMPDLGIQGEFAAAGKEEAGGGCSAMLQILVPPAHIRKEVKTSIKAASTAVQKAKSIVTKIDKK